MFHGVTDDTLSRAAAFSVMRVPPVNCAPGPLQLTNVSAPLVARPARGMAPAPGQHTPGGAGEGAGETTAGSGRTLAGRARRRHRAGSCAARLQLLARTAGRPVGPCRRSTWPPAAAAPRCNPGWATCSTTQRRRLPPTAERHRARSHRGRGMVRRRPARRTARRTRRARRRVGRRNRSRRTGTDDRLQPRTRKGLRHQGDNRRDRSHRHRRCTARPDLRAQSAPACSAATSPTLTTNRDWILDQRPQPPK